MAFGSAWLKREDSNHQMANRKLRRPPMRKAGKTLLATQYKSGFLYLFPTFYVWMRTTGPDPHCVRDLATPRVVSTQLY